MNGNAAEKNGDRQEEDFIYQRKTEEDWRAGSTAKGTSLFPSEHHRILNYAGQPSDSGSSLL